jgi:hypothetical protein
MPDRKKNTMSTRRSELPRNENGTPKSYTQRRNERRAEDRAKRMKQRQAKATAKADALLQPEAPRPPTYDQRQALRKAEDLGRADARHVAAVKAAAEAPPQNPYRLRQSQLKLYRGDAERRKWDHFETLAIRWDADRAAEIAAADRQAAIDNDPMIVNAREYAAGLVKLAPAEFQSEAAECAGIAAEGNAALAWSRMKSLEQRIWQHQDRLAAEKLANKAVSDSEFQASANAAEFARIAAEHSAMMDAELSPPDPEPHE